MIAKDEGDVGRFVEGSQDVPPVKPLKIPSRIESLPGADAEPYITPGFFLEKDYDPANVLRTPGESPPVSLIIVDDEPAHQDK